MTQEAQQPGPPSASRVAALLRRRKLQAAAPGPGPLAHLLYRDCFQSKIEADHACGWPLHVNWCGLL